MEKNANPELFSFTYLISVFISPNPVTCFYFFSLESCVFPLMCFWAELLFGKKLNSAINDISRFMLDNDLASVFINYQCHDLQV